MYSGPRMGLGWAPTAVVNQDSAIVEQIVVVILVSG